MKDGIGAMLHRWRALIILSSLFGGMTPPPVLGGGGPETTLVVVNADSAISRSVANAYVGLRDIPETHLVFLHDVPSLDTIGVETFRERIWRPIDRFLTENDLQDHIDAIVYSADFPYAVNLRADIKANRLGPNKYRGSVASLTGATYFARRVKIGDTGYLNSTANLYFRRNLAQRRVGPAAPAAADKLERRADTAYRGKNFAEAAALYTELLDLHPDLGRAWYNLARTLAALGRDDRAMAALRRAVGAGWTASLVVRREPRFKTLRDRSEFAGLLKEMEAGNGPFEPAQGFRSRYRWDRWRLTDSGNPLADLDRYYLSTLLAYTGVRGNSVPEVLGYVRAAAASDGTHPDATVYLLANSNVRSLVRQPYFIATAKVLERLGHRAEILSPEDPGQDGILPIAKHDVIGAVVGAPGVADQTL